MISAEVSEGTHRDTSPFYPLFPHQRVKSQEGIKDTNRLCDPSMQASRSLALVRVPTHLLVCNNGGVWAKLLMGAQIISTYF